MAQRATCSLSILVEINLGVLLGYVRTEKLVKIRKAEKWFSGLFRKSELNLEGGSFLLNVAKNNFESERKAKRKCRFCSARIVQFHLNSTFQL
jgi:hypothetical protein